MWHAFKLLARMKFLRGTALDLFGRTEERRLERQLIEDYRASISAAVSKLSADNLALVSELASLPEQIRGFGHVKLASIEKAKARWRVIEQALTGPRRNRRAQEGSLTGQQAPQAARSRRPAQSGLQYARLLCRAFRGLDNRSSG